MELAYLEDHPHILTKNGEELASENRENLGNNKEKKKNASLNKKY